MAWSLEVFVLELGVGKAKCWKKSICLHHSLHASWQLGHLQV